MSDNTFDPSSVLLQGDRAREFIAALRPPMRVEVEISPSALWIRWWPIEGRASWIVTKQTDYDNAATIRPAMISAGTRPSDPMLPQAARGHAHWLQRAAALCDALDRSIKALEDFKQVQVKQMTPGTMITITKSVGGDITIRIPDQSAYE